MPITVGSLRERAAGERRVAITPETAKKLLAQGARVMLEQGAGAAAGFPDGAYAGVAFATADQVLMSTDVLACVQLPDAEACACLKPGATVIGQLVAIHPSPHQLSVI